MDNKIHTIRKETPDSLEFGTPKNGVIKVYGDFDKMDEFKAKINNAIECKNYAQLRVNGELIK